MPKTTVQDMMNSRIPNACGVAPGDSRLYQWANEATNRLIFLGKWFDATGRFNICVTNGCVTLPRGIATPEAININGQPTAIRDFWYEFLANGLGTRESQCAGGSGGNSWPGCCGMNEAIYRGRFPTFADITGTTSKVNFVCDLSVDVGNEVIVFGFDQNNNWIRTVQNGVYADGEVIALAQSSGTISQNYFSIVTGVQFQDPMSGQSWLYGYDTSTSPATVTMLGHYQYDEVNPSYPRYYFPSIRCPSNSSTGCQTTKVEMIAKLEYMPVRVPTDYLILGNLPALKEMMVALKKSENEPDNVKANQIIASGMMLAKQILDDELDHETGSGRTIGMTVIGSSVGDTEPIPVFM
jgi:hypothetical protein